jgi:hypothetical protein
VPPRLETGRPSDVTGSYGPEAVAWIRHYLGTELRPWQEYALGRVLDHRADGRLRWRRVILTVSRQSGKSVLARGLCGWRLGAGDVFGEPQAVLQMANVRETAARIWKEAAGALEATAGARVRRGNGQEAIALADGSTWALAAATLDGGVGSSLSLAFVDEAWRIRARVVNDALEPALLAMRSAQLVLVSTAGDGGSELLADARELAITELADPDNATTLLLEWSAPLEAASDDREAWRLASPHWTPDRVEALEHAYRTLTAAGKEASWRSQYLNAWVLSASSWINPASWRAAAREELELPLRPAGTVAVNDAPEGVPVGYTLAVADGDRVKVAGRVFASRRELWHELELLARDRRGLTLLYPHSFEAHVRPIAGVRAVKVGTTEQRAGFSITRSAIADGRLEHDGGTALTEHVLAAVPSTVPDLGTQLSGKASPAPIYLARAMVWAVAHELRPDAARRPMIVAAA